MPIPTAHRPYVNLPSWEWLRPAPVATGAISCLDGLVDDQYLYYVVGSAFYRYDIINDSWNQLASPGTAPATVVTLAVHPTRAYYSQVISSTATEVKLAGLDGGSLVGKKITLISGTGAGQSRLITAISGPTVMNLAGQENSSAAQPATTRKADLRQIENPSYADLSFGGYQQRVVFNTAAATFTRPVLVAGHQTYTEFVYNSLAWPGSLPWLGAPSPVLMPGWGTAAQTLLVHEYHTATIDQPWEVVPDSSSHFIIESAGVMLFSSAAASPFFTRQYYNPLGNFWYTMETQPNVFSAALGTDIGSAQVFPISVLDTTETIVSATENILTLSGTVAEAQKLRNCKVTLTGGTGAGQVRRVIANYANKIAVQPRWNKLPDASSSFKVTLNDEETLLIGNAVSAVMKGDFNSQYLGFSPVVDWGFNRRAAIVDSSNYDYHALTVNSVSTVNGVVATFAVAAGGANYAKGDLLKVTGSSDTYFVVAAVSDTGAVLSVNEYTLGHGHTTGVKATVQSSPENFAASAGAGCTIDILSVTDGCARLGILMPNSGTPGEANHTMNFKSGNYYNLVNSDSTLVENMQLIAFHTFGQPYPGTMVTKTPATFSMGSAPGSTLIVDATKNWIPNEHVGRLLYVKLNDSVTAANAVMLTITGNTAKTISFVGGGAVTSSSKAKYFILEKDFFSKACSLDPEKYSGVATGGSTTTLVDASKNWPSGYWSMTEPAGGSTTGRKVRIISGTGAGSEMTITQNTSDTLTFAAQGFTVDATSVYVIMESFGNVTAGTTTTMTDNSQRWQNDSLVGQRVRFFAGTSAGNEYIITRNTASTVTFAAGVAPDTTTVYAILGAAPRGTGVEAFHTYGASNADTRSCVYMFRGGATPEIGRYCLRTDRYTPVFQTNFFETLTTGSMYAYDGEDRIYFTKEATGRIMSFNVVNNIVENVGTIPYVMGAATIGNRMFVKKTPDGLKYLYIMRHSAQEFWRLLIH